MIEKRKWVDVSDARPLPLRHCIVRRVLPNKKEWIVDYDFIRKDNEDWQTFLDHPKLGRITHWRYVTIDELKELNAKKVLKRRHPIEEKYVDNWDYNWYE